MIERLSLALEYHNILRDEGKILVALPENGRTPAVRVVRSHRQVMIRVLMKRRTLRQVKARSESTHHHHVYVVLLGKAARKLRSVRVANPARDPGKPCVYVGMTGLKPEERFANHRTGIKSASVVKRFGLRLLPELYAHLNPMPYEAALQMEKDLAEDLRRAGYTVTGGH